MINFFLIIKGLVVIFCIGVIIYYLSIVMRMISDYEKKHLKKSQEVKRASVGSSAGSFS